MGEVRKEFITLPLSEIHPYKNNPRINDGAVADVVESIKQCHDLDPIEIDEDNVILSGHTRLKALQRLNYTTADCLRYTGLTDAQKRKYRILTNTQVLEYDRLKSAVMGVGDIPARRETTHTTYVFNSEGKRITNTRNVETEYLKSAKVPTQSEDWTGANANMGTTRTAQRRLKNAMKWGKLQSAKR